ncbi:hypothetical protein BJ741DRAFT_631771 [Chytriomyces cf. hyalinus JEL632]|nr:hypothetical protein BJ741DRAFT_631771 [Chytriomyces cf. hyalinus JEL632]
MIETLLHLRYVSEAEGFTGVKSTKQLGVAWQRITREFNLTHVSDFKEVLSKGQLQTKHDHLKAEYAAIRSQLEKETGSRSGIDGDDGEQREPRCASRQRYSRENLPDYWETLVEYFWVVKGAPIFDDGRSEAADDSMEYIENSPVVSDSDSAPASPVLPKRRRSEEIERKIKKQRKQYREMKRLEEEELTQALTDMFNGFSKGLFALAAGIAARNNCA